MSAPDRAGAALSDDDVLDAARAWIADDPDPETRAELQSILDRAEADGSGAAALAELHDRFDTRLAFGTAGLRGELAAGPARMNRVLVAQAAGGLAAYLLERATPGATPSIVIGFDGRKNSDVFARDTAELMVGAGVRALLLPRLLPTPVLAFAVRHLGADAGVMVTASHNPARDNGYKVYLGGADGGSQIVPPADADIAAHIDRVAAGRVADLPRSAGYDTVSDSIIDAYVDATAGLAWRAEAAQSPATAAPRVVYTPMHGVGWETASRVFAAAGFETPIVVERQVHPDPEFPTVAFPNPEEEGALDLAFDTARAHRADLVIANDPDADRLAIAVPDPADPAGYVRLSGNDVGILLGWTLAEQAQSNGIHGTLAASIVSSPALARIASAYGLDYADTLTGFKWVSRVPHLLYGFEEALGYLVNPQTVRDKDGISAATVAWSLANELATRGTTIGDRMAEFVERFGHYASAQISLRVTDLSRIATVMSGLRQSPPSSVGDVDVATIDDLSGGSDTLPPSDVLRIALTDGSRIMVRPSGTEPKLKIYIDAFSDVGDAGERRRTAEERVATLADGMRTIVE